MTLRLHARLALDFSWRDLAYALTACARRPDAARAAASLESSWAPQGDGLACLSVRSAFDLYLTALALPDGSEVLLSGVTIPDMVRIVREHGLVPVPVDVDVATLFPTPRDCERAWSPRARVLVVAHLFGGRSDLAPLAAWARGRGVRIIEDCAQGFITPDERGSPLADAAFYSFGTIKTATALGGALVRVAEPSVLASMRALQDEWPEQSASRYAQKVARTALLLLVQRPSVYAMLAMLCDLRGRDFDHVIQHSVRGFPVPPGGTLLPLLRFRPCGALLDLLHHRLRTFDGSRLQRRTEQGERVMNALRQVTRVLGDAQPMRTHWLLAIESTDRRGTVARGRALGLDVAAGASSIAAVPRPAERPDLAPTEAERFMSRIIFVPAQPEIPARALDRIADLARVRERESEGRSEGRPEVRAVEARRGSAASRRAQWPQPGVPADTRLSPRQ